MVLQDDNKFSFTDDYIGHIFDTNLNNKNISKNIKTLSVDKIYNIIDTFENKNNYIINNLFIKIYLIIFFLLCILFFYI